jgi:hypothetical protein
MNRILLSWINNATKYVALLDKYVLELGENMKIISKKRVSIIKKNKFGTSVVHTNMYSHEKT